MDYGIRAILADSVFKVKIRDIDHLEERPGEAWAELSQAHLSNTVRSFRDRMRHCLRADGKKLNISVKFVPLINLQLIQTRYHIRVRYMRNSSFS